MARPDHGLPDTSVRLGDRHEHGRCRADDSLQVRDLNWDGKQAGEGIEYHLLAIAIALALVIRGGGKWSVDKAIADGMK